MIKIRNKTMDLLSLSWLLLGDIVFLLGWCRLYISIPIALLICYVLYKEYKEGGNDVLEISKSKFWASILISIILMWLCGIGGYVVQSADNYWRNAMFRDLVNYSWPVYDSATQLTKSYYIGFWMVPAVLAKIFHSMEFGFFSQLIWISLGFELLFLEISRYMSKVRLSYFFFFYLFSGMKVIECLLYSPVTENGSLMSQIVAFAFTNSTPGAFHAAPMVQLLYDPFNQTIALFLGMMYIINHVRGKLLPFVFASLLLYAPLPLVGLAPILLYWWGRNIIECPSKERLKYVFSLQNITAALVLVVSALYLMSNNQSGHKGLRDLSDLGPTIYGYVIYIFFEFVIFLLIGCKACRDKVALWISFVSVCLFGWFQIGLHNDFCFRTNMPLIFILCLLTIRRYYMSETSGTIKKIIVGLYVIGGIPAQVHPALRWISSACILTGTDQSVLNEYQHLKDVKTLYVMQQTKLRNDELQSSFACRKDQEQFRTDVGTKNSVFFKYLAKE